MPIYEYECSACGHRTELLQKMDAPGPDACPECGEPMRRLLSAPAFQFKGSGWYVTDYAGKGSDNGDKGGEKKDAGDKGGGESASASGDSGSSKTASSDAGSGKSNPASSAS